MAAAPVNPLAFDQDPAESKHNEVTIEVSIEGVLAILVESIRNKLDELFNNEPEKATRICDDIDFLIINAGSDAKCSFYADTEKEIYGLINRVSDIISTIISFDKSKGKEILLGLLEQNNSLREKHANRRTNGKPKPNPNPFSGEESDPSGAGEV